VFSELQVSRTHQALNRCQCPLDHLPIGRLEKDFLASAVKPPTGLLGKVGHHEAERVLVEIA
jgi:hypothetical protein